MLYPDIEERDLPAGRVEVRAQALLQELRRRPRRPVRRTLFVIASIVLLAIAAPALAFHQRLLDLFGDGQPVAPTSLGYLDRTMLDDVLGANGRTVQIASDGKLAFYVLTNDAGRYCLASGAASGPGRFASIQCSKPNPQDLLPSADHPIIGQPLVSFDTKTGKMSFLSYDGLVGDGVARVSWVDANKREVGSATVVDHVFELSRPNGSPIAVVGFDAAGREVVRRSLTTGAFGP